MGIIKVELGKRGYNIHIEQGIIGKVGELLSALPIGKKIMVITNQKIKGLYGSLLIEDLERYNFNVSMTEIPDGEEYKTIEIAKTLYSCLLHNHLDRTSSIIAFGGGVVGDLAGFVAATFMRGINFIQIPTTLLAQVDSSIGGKVGVNLDEAKNMIGAFYQPVLVVIDPEILKSLDPRELKAGISEVIKYGMIKDERLFSFLEESVDEILSLHMPSIIEIIMASCRIKAEVVAKDERERGYRQILNYGHTFGHAIEALTGYRVFRHGEAVAIGMVIEARLATLLGIFNKKEELRQKRLIQMAGLPTSLKGIGPQELIERIRWDKKIKGEGPIFILPTRIGDVIIKGKIEDRIIGEAIRQVME